MAEIDKLLVRIEAETAQLRRELERATKVTEASTAKIERSANEARSALARMDGVKIRIGQTLSAASSEVQNSARGMTAALGPVGAGLLALGPAGLVAGAALASAGLAFGAASGKAMEAVQAFDQTAKAADRIGVSTSALQELRYAADLAGVSSDLLDRSLQRLSRVTAEAAQGTGEAKDVLRELGISLTDAQGRLRPTEDLLSDVADRMAEIESPADRARIATKLFGEEGVAMVTMLGQGSTALADMRQKARDLGLVVEEDLLRNAEAMNDKFGTASKVIDTQLKVAFIELAPVIISVTNLVAGLLRELNQFMERFADMDELGLDGLKRRLADINAEIKETRAQLDSIEGGANPIGRAAADSQRRAAEERLRQLHAQAVDLNVEIARREAEAAQRGALTTPPPPPTGGGGGGGGGSPEIIDLRSPWATKAPPIPLPKGMTQEMWDSQERIMAAAQKGIDEYDERMRSLGETIRQEVMTPAEQLDARLAQLNELHRVGAIDAETFGRATSAAWDSFGQASATAIEQAEAANDVARDLGMTFSSAFEDAIVNGEKLGDVLKGLQQDLLRLATRKLITEPLFNAIAGPGGLFGGGGGGGETAAGGGMGGMFANLFHSGGVVGGPATSRLVSSAIFAGAERMHSGGVAGGLRGDEIPAILQRGEVVLPRGSGGAMQPVLNVEVINNTPSQVSVIPSNGGRSFEVIIDEAVSGALRSGGRTQQTLRQLGVKPPTVRR